MAKMQHNSRRRWLEKEQPALTANKYEPGISVRSHMCVRVCGCEGVACFGDQPTENFMHFRLGENVILKRERLMFNTNTLAHQHTHIRIHWRNGLSALQCCLSATKTCDDNKVLAMNRNNGHCVMPQNAVGCVKLQVCIHAHECVCMCVLVWNKHKTAAQTTKLTVISRKRKIEQCCMNAWHMCAVYGVARLRKKQKKNY